MGMKMVLYIEGMIMNKELSSYWNNKFKEAKGKYRQPSEFGVKAAKIMKKAGVLSLLELGFGSGRDAFYFDEQGGALTAVDISDEMVKHLSEKTKAQVINSDIKDIDFPNESFDAVYARLSLHYFSDEDTNIIFDKIFEMLKPKGLLFVQCKSINDWEYGKGEKIDQDTFKHGHIRHFFSEDYMRNKVHKFNIDEFHHENFHHDGKINHIISVVASKQE